MPQAKPEAGGQEFVEDESCNRSCRLMPALIREYEWPDPEAEVVSNVQFGAQHHSAGYVLIRVMVRARVPLEEIVELGEFLMVGRGRREVFGGRRPTSCVTRHRTYEALGCFAGQELPRRDGDEIDDLRGFLMQRVVAEIERRVLLHVHLQALTAAGAKLISAIAETQYRDLNGLLDLDRIDLWDAAKVTASRLQAPSHCTEELRHQIK